MFCKKCGAEVTGQVCPSCGTVVEENNYGQNTYQPVPQGNQANVLVWGILGIVFACTFYFSFLGIIFSAIGLSKAGAFVNLNGSLYGPAKVGKILSTVGLILSIIFAVIVFFVIIGIIANA